MRRWIKRQHQARTWTLTVSLLILALLPTPWPKVEFHNVRHHDAAGQVCEYHDHLLRWHPDASGAQDVAVLHWHWAWPSQAPDESEHGDGDGLRLHAHLPDEVMPDAESGPLLVADTSSRSLAPPAAEPLPLSHGFGLPSRDSHPARSSTSPALTFSATFAPRVSVTSRLHRWSC